MTIEVLLVADDEDVGTTTVATSIAVDTGDPRWPARIVDEVTLQAQEGARRLRDQLAVERAIPTDLGAAAAFVPLAALVPVAAARR
ncbi:MAG TPA: hypothetical protein VFD84_16455 [Candidatus Binatia bacterium]|nr:hypothetical protein [Candidatus Binatia bacterium]